MEEKIEYYKKGLVAGIKLESKNILDLINFYFYEHKEYSYVKEKIEKRLNKLKEQENKQ